MWRIFPILIFFQAGFMSVSTARVLGQHTRVTMYPPSQRVQEGQQALFTCFSSSPFASVVWKVLPKGRAVNPGKDVLSVTEIADSVSVLRIDEADPRKHRRTFACQVSVADVTGRISTHSAEASLKVFKHTARLHTNFPRITSASKSVKMTAGERVADIVCSSAADESQERPDWFWIKDNSIHLGLPGRTTSGKMVFSEGGSKLRINDFGSSDAGRYTCVASNRRGTAYSEPIVLEDSGESSGSCTDRDGSSVHEGRDFHPADDTCVTCTCVRGAARMCRAVGCTTPQPDAACAEYEFVKSRDKCCNFECKRPEESHHTCRDRDGKAVEEGETYMPDEDPCVTCTCRRGALRTCKSSGCETPQPDDTCEEYDFAPSRDQCCDFVCKRQRKHAVTSNTCIDRDGNAITHGTSYKPTADPCATCSCWNGREIGCTSISCSPPNRDVTCDQYVAAPSRLTCCNFECTRPRSIDSTRHIADSSSTCRDRDGNNVSHGDNYKPGPDPCLTCTCWNRYRIGCISIACPPPERDEMCDMYEAVRSRDTCCSFTCTRPRRRPAISEGAVTAAPATDYPLYCRDRQNNTVRNGEVFHPESDPCVMCRCVKGQPKLCSSLDCPEPECEYFERVPDKCCEFMCLEAPEVQVPGLATRVNIQQVGATAAIVQWDVATEEGPVEPARVSLEWRSPNTLWQSAYSGIPTQYVLLRDLVANVRYQLKVTATVGEQTTFTTEPETFTLDGRVGNLLHLGEARADILQAKSLYPNDFEPLANTDDMYLSLASFHMTRATIEQARDCPNGQCGVMRFYMYTADGYTSHYFSLMFTDIKDYFWAKAHL